MKRALRDRHREEIQFHDRKITTKNATEGQKPAAYCVKVRNRVYEDFLNVAGNFKHKKVLDFGCGEGWASAEYVKLGAKDVTAFDISFESLSSAREHLERISSASLVHLVQAAAEQLCFRDAMFDIVLCISTLHHTDLGMSLKQIHRILKGGGKAILIEPLGHNFAINFFRKLTPWRRSKCEKPINIDVLLTKATGFRRLEIHGYYLFSILALGLQFFHRNDRLLSLANDIAFTHAKREMEYNLGHLFRSENSFVRNQASCRS